MSLLTEVRSRIAGLARTEKDQYSAGQERPLGGYLATMAVYGAVVGTMVGLARLTKREVPGGLGKHDLVLHAVATHKLSRLLAKDPVTSPLRAPFTEYRGTEGPAELEEDARGRGARKAIGEMITCPFCLDLWMATGLMAGLIYLPRTTRLAIDTLATVAGADMLQFAYARLQQASSLSCRPVDPALSPAACRAGRPR